MKKGTRMVKIKHLSNGITVVFETMPYLRSASFGVWVKVGSVNENKSNNGIAHVIEHMLFKGTKNRNTKQMADDMARIGGNINAYTSKECTSYYATILSEHLPLAIDILSDMFQNSLIDEKDLKKEKSVIIEEIDMYEDSPEDLAHEMLQKKIWKDHPLGYIISGTKQNIRNISREQILDFMDTYYVGDNIIISVAGRFDEDEIYTLLEEKFGSIKQRNQVLMENIDKPKYHKVIYTKNKDIEQVHCNIAFDCISYLSDQRYVLTVFNSIFGGSINSRLFQIIRENSGLTYSIYSYGSSFRHAGLFHIYAAMNPSQTDTVFKKIYQIIEDIKKNGINSDELEMAKEQIKTDFILGSESAKSRMNSNGKSVINRGYVLPLDDIVAGIEAVTLDDIKEFANKYLDFNNMSISIVGNIKDSSTFIPKEFLTLTPV
ncbi:MAG: insulinase family protein [Clostridiales bacterium]|nr:insulinase family protein [Clostridiales bacterium]